MFEPIVYCLIGTVLAAGVFWLFIDWDKLREKGDSRDSPEDKKQPDPSCCPASCAEMISKVLLVFVVPWGVFCLALAVMLGSGLYDEWREHRF